MENGAADSSVDPHPATSPISLCSTVFNESESIDSWLLSVVAQTRRPDEIVICDAGSTDGTLERIRGFEFGEVDVKVIVREGANVPEGRNAAIEAATHDTVAVTDAGTILDPDWLELLVAPLERDPEVGVSAGFYRPAGRNRFERILATVITPRRTELADDGFPPSSRSVAFRREWWQRIGGYPEWLRAGEDLVFDFRLREQGAKFVFADGAIVSWYPRPSLGGFFAQYRHYARGDGHGHLYSGRHLIRYSAYLTGLFLLAKSRRHPILLLALTTGFSGYAKKFIGRVTAERPYDDRSGAIIALGLVPVIVVAGDVAKMIGYPQGLWERWQAGGPDGLQDARIASHRGSRPGTRPQDTIQTD